MAWLERFWRPYRPVEDWSTLGRGRVQVAGVVEALETLLDPLMGQPAVVIVYRAWPPSTTVGMDGGTAHNSRAFEVRARQSVDFLLCSGRERVVIRADPGDNVETLHRDLLTRYGVGLRSEVETIRPGDDLVVRGRVLAPEGGRGSPMRRDPYRATIVVEGLRRTHRPW